MNEQKSGRSSERSSGRSSGYHGEDEKKEAQQADARPTQDWGRQSVGAIIGAFVALILAGLAAQMGWIGGNLMIYALWGGVIGGLIGGSEALERAGARLTQRDNRALNIVVALIGMFVVFVFLLGLTYGISRLVQNLRGG